MRARVRWVVLVTAVVGVVGLGLGPARAADEPHDHGEVGSSAASGGRVGVLIADHGEPPEYNAWTYESFREFFQHLIDMGLIPSWLTALETGTILYDADCPACEEASDSPRLIDAWLRPHDGPGAFVPPSDSLPAHYVLPGGPGFREPDIFEHVGLSAWHEWQRMGGRSPNYDEKLPRKQAVIERLRAAYGDDLAIRVGYMIDPRFEGRRFGIREALDSLVNRDRIESLVVVYHGVGFSDIMQTHHLRHMVAEHLEALGADIPVTYAEPPGTSEHYVRAVVEKVQEELATMPPDADVAVHLSGHGLPTDQCGDYDCGADAYHRSSADLFARVRPALEAAIDRPGRTEFFHLYGDGGEGEDDPEDEVDGPMEALAARAAAGFTHVVDVPYEFDANSRDTLIVLRQGYGREAPDWDADWESHFTYEGMQVTLTNTNGGDEHKISALYDVTVAALGGGAASTAGRAPHDEHEAEAAVAVAGAAQHRTHGAAAARSAAPTGHAHEGDGHIAAADPSTVEGGHAHDDEDDHADGELAAATSRHGHDDGGGAGSTAGLLLAVTAGAAVAAALGLRTRPLAGRLVLGAVGVQLAGLAWDVLTHADAGEPVHLLENGGHWLALAGLVAAGAASAALLRRPERIGAAPR